MNVCNETKTQNVNEIDWIEYIVCFFNELTCCMLYMVENYSEGSVNFYLPPVIVIQKPV